MCFHTPVWFVPCLRQGEREWWMEAKDVCAVLSIWAITFPQEHLDALVLIPVNGQVQWTNHAITTVTHTISNSYQPAEDTGWKKKTEG